MISIIIPTFNEAANLPRLLEAIAGPGVPREILVVDGGE
jgi:glycosyltransferase involved in cell wall biosynthesis